MSVSPGNINQAQIRFLLAVEMEVLHSYYRKELLPLPKGGFRIAPHDLPPGPTFWFFQFTNVMLDEMAIRLAINNRNRPLYEVEDLDKMLAADEQSKKLFNKKMTGLLNEVAGKARYEFLKSLIPAYHPEQYERMWQNFNALEKIKINTPVALTEIPKRQPLCDTYMMMTRSREQFIAEQIKVLEFSASVNTMMNPVKHLADQIFGHSKKWSDGAKSIIDQLAKEVGSLGEPIQAILTAHFERHADRIWGGQR